MPAPILRTSFEEVKAPDGVGEKPPKVPETSRPVSVCQAPASPSAPSAQARKGAPLFENSIGLNGFSAGLRPFRNWALGVDGTAGAWGRDEIRNAEGHFAVLPMPGSAGYITFMETGFGRRTPRRRLSLPLRVVCHRATIYCPSLLFPMPSPLAP